jgi:hypothetical protein
VKITYELLKSKNACEEAILWGKEHFNGSGGVDYKTVFDKLIVEDRLDWANWLIVRVMTRPQYLSYAIFAAEQVIGIFEKKYPDYKRPRKSIEAAKAVLKNDTEQSRKAAASAAAYAADVAASAADAAASAAYAADSDSAAAYAADAAAYAAASAADAAACAAYAADSDSAAADAAACAAYAAAKKEMNLRILKYVLKLLEGGE